MKAGDVIEGRYLVEEMLGEGGMARVFRVRHVGLGSLHALKVLNPDLAERVEVRTRFAAEGKIQAQIRHPNIVAVTEVVAEPGLYGLVMDYVDGPPMDAYLAGLAAPPSGDTVRAFMLPVLDAIGLAHRHGVVHRDLKPENILVGRDARGQPWPRVTDFGIAKVKQEAESERATRTGTSMGTRGYMSPEQIKSSKDVSSQSDIFSLGATLYELATLKQAFAGDSDYEVMDRIVHERFVAPEVAHPGIDPVLARAIVRALRADPGARFASCAEFAAALRGEALEAQPATQAPPLTLDAQPGEAPRRHDTVPDASGALLDAATFAPIAVTRDEPRPSSVPIAVFEKLPAEAPDVERAWQAVKRWASMWPPAVRDALQLQAVEAYPVHRLQLHATFEKRDARTRDLAFPADAIPPSEGVPAERVQPFAVSLPPVQVPDGRAETFVMGGTVSVRTCTACRAQGATTCATCGGAGGTRCSTCSGTGSTACVLCDGIGTVPKFGGEGLVICPGCRGTNIVTCSAAGCREGMQVCAECDGDGARECHFCSGAGRIAKATVVTRVSRLASGTSVVEFGLSESVRVLTETLTDAGQHTATLALGESLEAVDPRLPPFVGRADAMASRAIAHFGAEWQITQRALELSRLQVFRVSYSAGSAEEHHAWVVGEALEVIGSPTPLEAWRRQELQHVVSLAESADAEGLRRVDLLSGFEPGDARLAEVSRRIAGVTSELWDRGELVRARSVRDALPAVIAQPTAEAIAAREVSTSSSHGGRRRRAIVALVLAAVGTVGIGLAAMAGYGPPSCEMRGTWLGGTGGAASMQISFELGSLVHGSVRMPDGVDRAVEVRGTCDPTSRRFQLNSAQGTLIGELEASGRALSASWTPAAGTPGHAVAMPFVLQ